MFCIDEWKGLCDWKQGRPQDFFLGGGEISQHAKRAKISREARKIFWVFAPPKTHFAPPQQAIFGGGEMSLGGGAKTQKYSWFS